MANDFITPEGFEAPALADLLDRTTAEQRAAIDPLFANTPDTIIGIMNGIDASHEREAYEAVQVAFDAINPDNAEDAELDSVCAITGTFREPAKPTRFAGSRKLSVTMDPGAVVTAGATVFAYTPQPSIRFVATESYTNTGPTQIAKLIAAECEDTGPIAINAGTVTTIATPSPGLIAVTNPDDGIIGGTEEGNTALRRRREEELRQGGATTNPALTADLLAFTNEDDEHPVISVVVLENLTDTTDANGLPPHSFEAVVWDGPGAPANDDEIAAIVNRNRPIGTPAVGSITSALYPLAPFSRPTSDQVDVTIALRKTGTLYVGDAAVKSAIAAASQSLQAPSDGSLGSGIVAASVYAGIALDQPGVNRVLSVLLKLHGDPGPGTPWADLPIAVRHVATIQTADITVISSEGP